MKKNNLIFFFVISIIYIFSRVYWSDPWGYSIGTNDTNSYVKSSQISISSSEFYFAGRSITLPLLYKVFTPPGGYGTINKSEPTLGKKPGLKNTPGYNGVAIFQRILSIFSWWCLGFVIFFLTKNKLVGGLGAILLFVFSWLPYISSWDHVLMSESLSYSLVVLLIAISLMLFDHSFWYCKKLELKKILLSIFFILIAFFWVFTRDTNVYALLIMIILLILGTSISVIKNGFKFLNLMGIIIIMFLIGIFLFQQASFRSSTRYMSPLLYNMTKNIFPYPTRVQFFVDKWGMPTNEELLVQRNSPQNNNIMAQTEFIDWVKEKGVSAYTDFLIHSPLWVAQTLINSLEDNFVYYDQPYYDLEPIKIFIDLSPLSRLMNPHSSGIVMISLVIVIGTFLQTIKKKSERNWSIVGIMICLWICAGALYAFSYLGDPRGSVRHVQTSILIYKLIIWTFIPIILDRS